MDQFSGKLSWKCAAVLTWACYISMFMEIHQVWEDIEIRGGNRGGIRKKSWEKLIRHM